MIEIKKTLINRAVCLCCNQTLTSDNGEFVTCSCGNLSIDETRRIYKVENSFKDMSIRVGDVVTCEINGLSCEGIVVSYSGDEEHKVMAEVAFYVRPKPRLVLWKAYVNPKYLYRSISAPSDGFDQLSLETFLIAWEGLNRFENENYCYIE